MPMAGHKSPSMLSVVLVLWTVEGFVGVSGFVLPFGDDAGDTALSLNPSPAISLPSNFLFFGDSYGTVYANLDGFVTFTTSGDVFSVGQDFDQLALPVICAFCADWITLPSRPMWYRLSTNTTDLQTIQDLTQQHAHFGASFNPAWLFVVTWDQIFHITDFTQFNSMQIVLASDGTSSLVLLDYELIEWEDGVDFPAVDVSTKVGFNKGDMTTFYSFPESQTTNVSQLPFRSNINSPGQFLFRTDQETIPYVPPTTTTTSTDAPTTTTTNVPETTTTSAATAVPSTTDNPPESDSSFDPTNYYIGFGVSGGVLLLAGIAFIIVGKVLSRRPSAKVVTPNKVKPASNGHAQSATSNGRPPSDHQVKPFRIPRPYVVNSGRPPSHSGPPSRSSTPHKYPV